MSRSHLAIRHLVRQLEQQRADDRPKPVVPHWLQALVQRVSEAFEPFSGVARAGYECFQAEHGWEVALFLGECEMVGGKHDGTTLPVNFKFDLLELHESFKRIDALSWNAFPNSPWTTESVTELSFLTVSGTVDGHHVLMQIHAISPEPFGPALKQHQDGRIELV